MESILSRMAEPTKDNGSMENSMEKVCSLTLMETKEKVCGMKVNASNGLTTSLSRKTRIWKKNEVPTQFLELGSFDVRSFSL
jgi:hypothetical protein